MLLKVRYLELGKLFCRATSAMLAVLRGIFNTITEFSNDS